MQVYFAGAIMGGRENLPVYQHIVAWLQAAGHEVPSAHVADPAVLSRESALSREVYERDVAWIETSDAMVAEVSTPSLGVGYEVGYGLRRGLPVLCLYRRGLSVSKMITGNPAPTLVVATYSDLTEIDARLAAFLTSVVAGNIHV
jgi:2'-deoxynucleoside 5'-phosphate N-hydrolase